MEKEKRIKIIVECKNSTSYFYYPDLSCKTDEGGMKMLMKKLKEIREPYELKIIEEFV